MSRFESVSPLVVAWGVALAFSGLLLLLMMTNDPPVESPHPLQADRGSIESDSVAQKPTDATVSVTPTSTAEPDQKKVTGVSTDGQIPLGVNRESKTVRPSPMGAGSHKKDDRAEVEKVEDRTSEKNAAAPLAEKKGRSHPVKSTNPASARKPVPEKVRPASEISRALALPISEFRQEKPVAVRVLLKEVATLAGVEFVFDPLLADDPELQRKMALTMKATTIDQILVNVLARLRLQREVREGHVWIRRGETGDASP